jgi:hypothetical protein
VPRRRSSEGPFNPLRKESDAFRVLVWFVVAVAAIVAVVLIVRALS